MLPALAIFSGFIVLANDNVLEYLNLLEFEQKNGFAFAIVFLICASLIVCYIASYLVDIFVKQIKAVLLKEKMYKKFNNLQDVYKNTLIQIYRQPTKSLKMEMSNSVAAYLTAIRAIDRSELTSSENALSKKFKSYQLMFELSGRIQYESERLSP